MFTPPAPLNRVPSGCSTGVKSERYFTGACPACPARPVECETYSSGVGQNDRTGVNSYSACLLAKSDRIGGDRLDLLHRGGVIPLGVRRFFKQVSHKAPLTHNEGGAFLF